MAPRVSSVSVAGSGTGSASTGNVTTMLSNVRPFSETQRKGVFRETLGVPGSRYVQGYRIQQAIVLLATSGYNVTETAHAVGFESLSHFNATFRTFTGQNPTAYVKASTKK